MAERQIIIHRTNPQETRIQNSIIWDKKLSLSARFSLIAMLSLPDSWDYSVRGMAKLLDITKDTMSKYLRELEAAGYLKREQKKSEKGTFAQTVYIMTDSPGNFGDEDAEEPCHKKSDTDEQMCRNFSAPEKSPQKKRTKEKNEDIPPLPPKGGKRAGRKKDKSVPSWNPERFEAFWEYYRTHARGEDRQGAAKAWDKLQPDDALIDTMARALRDQVWSESWQDGVGIPYAKTWLNNARWKDTPKAPRDPGPPDEEGRQYGWH